MSDYIVQEEDGASHITLEEDDGDLLQEEDLFETPITVNVDLRIS